LPAPGNSTKGLAPKRGNRRTGIFMMEHEEQIEHPAPLVPQPEAPLAESAPAPLEMAPHPQAPPVEETAMPETPVAEAPEPTAVQLQQAEGRKRAQEAWNRISGAKDTGETISANVK